MGKQSKEQEKKRNQNRHTFLLTFFDQPEGDHYEEKPLNGFWLIKQWNGGTHSWQVAIYTEEAFHKKAEFSNFYKPQDTATDVSSSD